MQRSSGFTRITSDRIINEGHTHLFGLIVEASVDGGDVSIYEGIDAQSGRLFSVAKGLANVHDPITFDPPVFFDRGLFVDIGSNVTAVTVLWRPVKNPVPYDVYLDALNAVG